MMTLEELVTESARQMQEAGLYFGHGTDNALDEALLLALHVLELQWETHEGYLDTEISAQQTDQIRSLVSCRIESRVPAAYLTGKANFCGMTFEINEHVLVPRSPIAELVMDEFAPWTGSLQPEYLLDLCAGSGCIGIACARYLPGVRVDLADISDQALQVACDNIARHGLEKRVRAIRSDLFENLNGQRYDLIVCNPPYVPQREYSSLPEEYHHEPALGLLAEDEGLALVEKILEQAPAFMRQDSYLIMEVGNSMAALMNRFPDLPAIWPEFEHGGDGVFIISAKELNSWKGNVR